MIRAFVHYLIKNYYKFVEKNHDKIEAIIDYSRDYQLTYFGFKTLEKSYLLRHPGEKHPIERPQDMWMRVAISLNLDSFENSSSNKVIELKDTYDCLSQGFYTHASPTLFNAGTQDQQMLSCFLLGSEE